MTEMGGIYNRALFKSAKTRPALNKLSKMGGISSLNKRQDSASRGVSGLGSISGAQPMMAPPPMMPQQQMAPPPMMPQATDGSSSYDATTTTNDAVNQPNDSSKWARLCVGRFGSYNSAWSSSGGSSY